MAKKIYLSKLYSYLNQRLANLIINKQFLAYEKNIFYKYKKMYLISKVWIFFEFNLSMPK